MPGASSPSPTIPRTRGEWGNLASSVAVWQRPARVRRGATATPTTTCVGVARGRAGTGCAVRLGDGPQPDESPAPARRPSARATLRGAAGRERVREPAAGRSPEPPHLDRHDGGLRRDTRQLTVSSASGSSGVPPRARCARVARQPAPAGRPAQGARRRAGDGLVVGSRRRAHDAHGAAGAASGEDSLRRVAPRLAAVALALVAAWPCAAAAAATESLAIRGCVQTLHLYGHARRTGRDRHERRRRLGAPRPGRRGVPGGAGLLRRRLRRQGLPVVLHQPHGVAASRGRAAGLRGAPRLRTARRAGRVAPDRGLARRRAVGAGRDRSRDPHADRRRRGARAAGQERARLALSATRSSTSPRRPPNEPTFSTRALASQLAPLPLAALHATHDEFVPSRRSSPCWRRRASPSGSG